MTSFKPFGKTQKSGHKFPASFGFSSSSGKTQEVRGYTRKVPKYAEGGAVDSPVIKRSEPMTEADREYGGTGPLRPGFKKGGKIGPIKKGALHEAMGIPQGKKIGVSALQQAKNSSSPLMRKRANFALNARKWDHSGGKSFKREPLIGD